MLFQKPWKVNFNVLQIILHWYQMCVDVGHDFQWLLSCQLCKMILAKTLLSLDITSNLGVQ